MDFLALVLALLLSAALKYGEGFWAKLIAGGGILIFPLMLGIYLLNFLLNGLYNLELAASPRRTFIALIVSCFWATLIVLIFAYLFFTELLSRYILLYFVSTGFLLVFTFRYLYENLWKMPENRKRTLIIGAGENAGRTAEYLKERPELGFKVVGFIKDLSPAGANELDELLKSLQNNRINALVLSDVGVLSQNMFAVLTESSRLNIEIIHAPSLIEEYSWRIPLDYLDNFALLEIFSARGKKIHELIKRIFDIAIALVGFLIFAPWMPLAALFIRLESRGRIIFAQERVGRNGKIFTLYKLRTMYQEAEDQSGPVWASKNDRRVTRVGKILRTLHLDEVPQLYNILKGEMSFIGPRPERPYFVDQLEKLIQLYRYRTVIKPGVTGWAQVNIGYAANLEEQKLKFEYDLCYIKNRNPALDLYIIARTLKMVLTGRGVR